MRRMNGCSKLTVWTLIGVALQITGLSLFVLGFFPVKPALSGFSGADSYVAPATATEDYYNVSAAQLRSLYQDLSQLPTSYTRLILMVVDGLPAEFLLANPPSQAYLHAMPYTHSLLSDKTALGYHAKAAPPTVTMPRLKAMLSGAVGGFLDVAFNFNTQAFLHDNLLHQLYRIGWNMSMFGDETWLKLFPQLFIKQDGVSSFFVKDTIQVDLNVSRHLPGELYKDDWNLMILHYLGVDHVGHIGGRKSALMAPKLREMDDVIKMIHLNCILSRDREQGDTLLLVVSDHGMTDSGNHGGSSYEETDALALFISPNFKVPQDFAPNQDRAKQVDITPTLAVLLGVPIPKNNVGVLSMGVMPDFTDGERLRALELNSWQLLRLLKSQLPHLSCAESAFGNLEDNRWSEVSHCSTIIEEMFCCLYSKAASLHKTWKNTTSRSKDNLYNHTITSYDEFLITASDWLTRRVTDKPFGQLALGMLVMILSCIVFVMLLFYLRKEEGVKWNQGVVGLRNSIHNWSVEETFVVAVIIILIVSMGSSSMVEEEQYIWHFMTSTLFWILLRKTMKFLPGVARESCKSNFSSRCSQVWSILVILISGRIMRAWHQGGVNWTHLPDISKWLELAGNDWIKTIKLISAILVTGLSVIAFYGSRLHRCGLLFLRFFFLLSGSLVVLHVVKYEGNIFMASNHGATFTAQMIYTLLSIATCIAVLASPWLLSVPHLGDACSSKQISGPLLVKDHMIHLRAGLKECSYLTGWTYILSWALLQLLLQQPINSMPVVLLLLQVSASMVYFVNNGSRRNSWVEVASLYFLGMAGHFGLGNSNTLATIDVAGAFIGISSHSTLLSGILMFCITYASPMFVLLSLAMHISLKDGSESISDETMEFGEVLKSVLAIPLLVPLAINSVLLIAYTVILLQMRHHLFIWSVFSPKYLYVCATTVCVYIGISIVAATEIYICMVYNLRTQRLLVNRNAVEKTPVGQ